MDERCIAVGLRVLGATALTALWEGGRPGDAEQIGEARRSPDSPVTITARDLPSPTSTPVPRRVRGPARDADVTADLWRYAYALVTDLLRIGAGGKLPSFAG